MAIFDIIEQPYVKAVLFIIIILYSSFARPQLPQFIINIFESPIFRLLIFALIIYRGNKDPIMSLLLAIAFVITMYLISDQKKTDMLAQAEGFRRMTFIRNSKEKNKLEQQL